MRTGDSQPRGHGGLAQTADDMKPVRDRDGANGSSVRWRCSYTALLLFFFADPATCRFESGLVVATNLAQGRSLQPLVNNDVEDQGLLWGALTGRTTARHSPCQIAIKQRGIAGADGPHQKSLIGTLACRS
ncbi:hypothetical protein PSEUDO9AG_40055 [Pseudomonas sp. 9Ag]|nr:hypothetical protein PSEUDO9AG_40055 [Pseudomonas sp. 9Ag]